MRGRCGHLERLPRATGTPGAPELDALGAAATSLGAAWDALERTVDGGEEP